MLKIVLVGPKECGKSLLCNYLADPQESLRSTNPNYHPTKGVRILETEVKVGHTMQPVALWDCSGDQCYESCWPALMKDADGVILIFNPENHGSENEALLWFEWFIQNPKIDHDRCLLFGHTIKDSIYKSNIKLPPGYRSISTCLTSGSAITEEFNELIKTLTVSKRK